MRAVLAGLFVFTGLLLAVSFLTSALPANFPPVVLGIGMAMILLALTIGALFLFNKRGGKVDGYQSSEDHLRELEQKGLLEKSDYWALRAFSVEEFEDEGSSFFTELEDRSVLLLTGQYLYDYGSTQVGQPRTFPCSEFTVLRPKVEGWVVDLQCHGSVFQPECEVPPFSESDFKSDRMPADGEIIKDRTYEEVKRERLRIGT